MFGKNSIGGLIKEGDHGLFFIERGMLRVEQNLSDNTISRTRSYLGTSALHGLKSFIGQQQPANNNTNKISSMLDWERLEDDPPLPRESQGVEEWLNRSNAYHGWAPMVRGHIVERCRKER